MAGPNKRRAIGQRDSESSEDESESSSNIGGGEEIQADFEGRNPEGQDFHGIKQLLQQLFLKAHLDLSQLTDMIIAQSGVGSVLKQSTYDDEMNDEEEDDLSDPLDVFGITTAINLSSHKETPCIQQLLSLLSDLCKKHGDKSLQAEVEEILTKSKRLGLLLNERFVNIPAKISDPLLTSLTGELDRIKKKDPSYDFQYFIMICKLHKSKQNGGEILFANAEEEIFFREAKASFEFNVTAQSDTSVSGSWKEGDVEMIPYRRILFIDGHKLNNIVQQIKALVA